MPTADPLKVLHLNTLLDGGAAIAAKRIHQSLLDCHVDSHFLFRNGWTDGVSYMKWQGSQQKNLLARVGKKVNIFSRIERVRRKNEISFYMDGRPGGYEQFSLIRLEEKLGFEDFPVKPDIVHLHWIAGFFDYTHFFGSIPAHVPIVWTLHDMNPFTGGCHYSWECDGFKRGCGNCPQLANPAENDLSRKTAREKFDALTGKLTHIVADSHWIERQARESKVFSGASSFQTIHYGLDMEKFERRDNLSCKQALGVPPGSKVILFGADYLNNRRKGFAELVSGMRQLLKKDKDIFFLTFGYCTDIEKYNIGRAKHLGYVKSTDMLSIVYSAADVFVMPSLYEAFGQVALEAMAFGVPVVSFRNGGAEDMVTDGVTGALAKRGSAEDLATKLQEVLENESQRKRLGENARKLAANRFSKHEKALEYKTLYEDVLSTDSSGFNQVDR